MTSNSREPIITLDQLLASLESFRSRFMDLEATAHAAADALGHVPYLPPATATKPGWTPEERRNYGRLQALVSSTATTAASMLGELDELLDTLVVPPRGGGDVSGSNGSEPDAGNGQDPGSHDASAPDGAVPGRADDAALLPRSRTGVALDAHVYPLNLA